MRRVAPRVLLCGGEERGTWLLKQGVASDRSFAFALALEREPVGALARVTLGSAPEAVPAVKFSLEEFFTALIDRRSFEVIGAPGLRLNFTWL